MLDVNVKTSKNITQEFSAVEKIQKPYEKFAIDTHWLQ